MFEITDDQEERISLIADGCRVSQEEAERMYRQQLETNKFAIMSAERLKRAQLEQRMRKRRKRDGKSLATGEI